MNAPFIDIILLAMLAVTAISIARMRNLFAAAMLTGIFSLLGACWMVFLDAPDVAFTEAAVGAGLSTVLILATLCVLPAQEKDTAESPLALVAVLLTGGVLLYGTLDMPSYGDPNSPRPRTPSPRRTCTPPSIRPSMRGTPTPTPANMERARSTAMRSASPTPSPRCSRASAATTRWARPP